MIKSAGITRTPSTVPNNIPPTAENPIDLFPLAPAPVENIRGMIPIMKASDVIRIGRRRTFAPSAAESMIDMPFSLLADANSTIRIAFLEIRVMSQQLK